MYAHEEIYFGKTRWKADPSADHTTIRSHKSTNLGTEEHKQSSDELFYCCCSRVDQILIHHTTPLTHPINQEKQSPTRPENSWKNAQLLAFLGDKNWRECLFRGTDWTGGDGRAMTVSHLRGGVGSEEAAARNHHLAGIPSTFTPRGLGRKEATRGMRKRMSWG
jgi:hypothetical protein